MDEAKKYVARPVFTVSCLIHDLVSVCSSLTGIVCVVMLCVNTLEYVAVCETGGHLKGRESPYVKQLHIQHKQVSNLPLKHSHKHT